MAAIDWYWDDETWNRVVVRANRVGLGMATLAEATKGHSIAEALMAPHHASSAKSRAIRGQEDDPEYLPSEITVSTGNIVDSFVNLDDPHGQAAGAIELGTRVLRRTQEMM